MSDDWWEDKPKPNAWVFERREERIPCPKCGTPMDVEATLNPDACMDWCPSCGYVATVTPQNASYKSRTDKVISFKAMLAAKRAIERMHKDD